MSDDIEKRAREFWFDHAVSGQNGMHTLEVMVAFARSEATRARIEELRGVVKCLRCSHLGTTIKRRIAELEKELAGG